MQEQLKKNLEELGIEGEGLRLFSVVLIPLLSEFIEQMLLNAFTDEEVMSIEKQLNEEDFDDIQKVSVYGDMYEEKMGKTIEEEASAILNEIIEEMKKSMDLLVKITEKIDAKDLTEEQKIQEVESYTQNLIERQNQKIKNLE